MTSGCCYEDCDQDPVALIPVRVLTSDGPHTLNAPMCSGCLALFGVDVSSN